MNYEIGRFLQRFVETRPQTNEEQAVETAELAKTVHSRYLGLLRTYGGLEVGERRQNNEKYKITTARHCPPLLHFPGFVELIGSRATMMVTLDSDLKALVSDVPASEIGDLDIPDDSVMHLAITLTPLREDAGPGDPRYVRINNILYPERLGRVSSIGSKQEVANEFAEGDYTKLLGMADFLESEYREKQAGAGESGTSVI